MRSKLLPGVFVRHDDRVCARKPLDTAFTVRIDRHSYDYMQLHFWAINYLPIPCQYMVVPCSS